MPRKKSKLSEGTKIALIGATATIVTALLTGIFGLLLNKSTSQSSPSPLPNFPAPSSSQTNVDTPPQVHVSFSWPNNNFYNLDIDLNVSYTPPASKVMFWAHQFKFINSKDGYIGLQDSGGKHKAIFSIWDATGSLSNNCEQFAGEGTGWHCTINYDWQVGHSYRLRVWRLDKTPEGAQTWGGYITDYTTNTDTLIGVIVTSNDYAYLSPTSTTWTEYAGYNNCDVTYSNAQWSNPIARNVDGENKPESATVTYGQNDCKLSNVELISSKNYSYGIEAGIGVNRTTPENTSLWK